MKDPWDALSDPTRREILNLLRGGWLNASGISQNFPFTKSTISRHLEILEDSCLIESEKRKQYVYYRLKSESFQPLREYLSFLESGTAEEPEQKKSPSPAKKQPVRRTSSKESAPVPAEPEPAEPAPLAPKEKEPVKPVPSSRRGKVPSYLD